MLQSATPVLSCVQVPEVLPVVMPDVPAVPAMLPAVPAQLTLPASLPADLPAEGRAALASALAGPVPGRPAERGDLVQAGAGACWDEDECARLLGFLDLVEDTRDPRGRLYPLRYLLALPLVAGMAGDDETDAAAEWAASAPADLLIGLGAPPDRAGRPRRPDATTISRILGAADQVAYDDALCGWAAARARAQRPGMRRHLRIDGKALHGARREGRTPMLLSGVWDDGTTAAQLPVDKKTNEIPVLRKLLKKIPDNDLAGAVITADQMHTQRKHAELIYRKNAYWLFTIGENQPKLFAAADAMCWEAVAVDAWTVDRGHGRIDVRTIKVLPPSALVSKLFPHVTHVFLVERYSYGTDGNLLGAVAVLGITSLPPHLADPADLLAYLRGHWSVEMHHYVRDVVFGEDASPVSRAHQARAAIRNTVIGILHLHQVPNIAAQLRACHRDPYRLPLQLLGLTKPAPRPAGNLAAT
jgi:predicted transposase YbfD/YdcC